MSIKPQYIIATVATVSVLTAVGFMYYQHSRSSSDTTIDTTNNNPLSDEEKRDAEHEKANLPSASASDTPNSPASSPDIPAASVTIVINRAAQAGPGQKLSVRATINGATTGNCVMTFSRSGQSAFTKIYPLVAGPSFATCGEADVASTDFTTGGTWQLSLTLDSSGQDAEPALTAIEVAK